METKPGNAERGWNDPPEFMHTSSQAPAPSQKRNFLNKRVVYPGIAGSASGVEPACTKTPGSVTTGAPPPLVSGTGAAPPLVSGAGATQRVTLPTNTPDMTQGAATSSSGAALNPVTLGAPPTGGVILFPPASSTDIPRFTAPIIVPTMSPKDDAPLSPSIVTIATNPVTQALVNTRACDQEDLDIPDFDDDEQMYHFVVTRLQKTCIDCASVVKPRIVEDINRKLDVFSKMWKDGKISYPVKSSMARLSTALHRRKCDIAHEIHLNLMMDFVSEVGQWMVGIKRLIQEARNIEAPMSPTNSTVGPLDTVTETAGTATAGTETAGTQQRLENSELSAENSSEQASTDRSNDIDVSHTESTQEPSSTDDLLSTEAKTDHGTDNSERSSVDGGPAIISTSPITD